jgi:DNA-binding PadR family transcriptional regulator
MNKSGMYKGLLEPLILKLLHQNGRMYGYEITQKAREISKGELTITEGALYPLLHKLEGEGMIEAETEKIGNRVRKYYSLTKLGKKETKKTLEELSTFMQTMGLFLNLKLT